MLTNPVKQRLREGGVSVGTWLALPCPFAARAIARLGFDWYTVDMEHGPLPIDAATLMMTAVRDSGAVPFVRVPWNDGVWFKQALDNGAWGVVVPMVMNRAEAERAVDWCRHEPLGRRSTGGWQHALSWQATGTEYYQRANDEIFVAIQIEHIRAVEQVDDIVSVPGIDAVFVGPMDLTKSMGFDPPVMASESPTFIDAMAAIRTACDRHGVAPGMHCSGVAHVQEKIAEGWRFLACSSDLGFMLGKAGESVAALKLTEGRELTRY
ncbi:MAG: 2-dehydro-3-deoxyglucarate aldolase [Armatimonadetes bacterium]|nr:2-dehydro-3-deoxyglucarate aldolase [Armatimonadota bacterium]